MTIKCGVPQGFILGLLFLLLTMNQLTKKPLHPPWLSANKLSLIIRKTHFIKKN